MQRVQHNYGAATRLIDFTTNAFIALWFACLEHYENYGFLLGTNIKAQSRSRYEQLRNTEDIQLPLQKLLTKYPGITFVWEPTHLFDRMRVQQSAFLLAKSTEGPWGCITEQEFNYKGEFEPAYFGLAISPELKDTMRSHWNFLFGYDVATLFPDIAGFGRYHSAESDFEWDHFDELYK